MFWIGTAYWIIGEHLLLLMVSSLLPYTVLIAEASLPSSDPLPRLSGMTRWCTRCVHLAHCLAHGTP